jgi:pimeloyl-ACP methyl ester carboxylesterase
MSILKYMLCLLGIVLAIPILVLLLLVIKLPITILGLGYVLGALLIAAGLILAPKIHRYYVLIVSGVIVVALVAGTRIFLIGQNTSSGLKVIALPQGKPSSPVNALIDEQDSLIFGEALFHLIGGDSDNEHVGLTLALSTDYSEMRKQGIFSSPIVSTYLGLQRPKHFDVVIIESQEQPQFGVVFLHGYMGNVAAQCWEVAQAVKGLGGLTVCPSTGWTGEWWQPDGQAILQATFDYIRAQGIQRLYLGGFSNGGFGISRLASQWKDEKGLAGLFFIDGFANGADIREVGLPVLTIEGMQDERVPVAVARQFATEVGDLGAYAEIEGDHFLIMKHPASVQNEIMKWLEKQERVK